MYFLHGSVCLSLTHTIVMTENASDNLRLCLCLDPSTELNYIIMNLFHYMPNIQTLSHV